MNILKKLKNAVISVSLPIFAALPKTNESEILLKKESENEKESDISEDDAIKFAENAIEYNPETKLKMISYYQSDRDAPKKSYIVGQVGTRLDLESREALGNGFKVKRKD